MRSSALLFLIAACGRSPEPPGIIIATATPPPLTNPVQDAAAEPVHQEAEAGPDVRPRAVSWVPSTFEQWRSAIENYKPAARPSNRRALGVAAPAFATYLTHIHNRVHPIFADGFLASLEEVPKEHPLNHRERAVLLEIVLRGDGSVEKIGVVRSSGVTAFDIAALDSIQRASPFGPAPRAIVSADGRVYFHWDLLRDPAISCSTTGAQPFILN
jgi:TonB family protein